MKQGARGGWQGNKAERNALALRGVSATKQSPAKQKLLHYARNNTLAYYLNEITLIRDSHATAHYLCTPSAGCPNRTLQQ
jgi:hypothetical protein